MTRIDLDVNRISIVFHLLVQANQSECWTKGKHFKLLIIFLEDLSQSSKQLFKAVCILYKKNIHIHKNVYILPIYSQAISWEKNQVWFSIYTP